VVGVRGWVWWGGWGVVCGGFGVFLCWVVFCVLEGVGVGGARVAVGKVGVFGGVGWGRGGRGGGVVWGGGGVV